LMLVFLVGARLNGWRRTESDGTALQMPCVPNRTKGHGAKKEGLLGSNGV